MYRPAWLYGPRIASNPPHAVVIPGTKRLAFRPVVLDIEDVVDLGSFLRTYLVNQTNEYEGSTVRLEYSLPARGPVTMDELVKLGGGERDHVLIDVQAKFSGGGMTRQILITLATGEAVVLATAGGIHGEGDDAQADYLATSAVDWILKQGKPFVQWRLLAFVLPVLPALAMTIAYLIALASGLSLPALVFGLAATIGAWAVGVWFSARVYANATERTRGVRIRLESRSDTNRRRADHKRDWVVGLLTFAGTVILTIIGWIITINIAQH